MTLFLCRHYMYSFVSWTAPGSKWKQIVFSRDVSRNSGTAGRRGVRSAKRVSRRGIGLHRIGKGVALRWMSIAKTRKSDGPEEAPIIHFFQLFHFTSHNHKAYPIKHILRISWYYVLIIYLTNFTNYRKCTLKQLIF